ncbi:hypothetical protein K469DRAFT_619710 [Zopfia rhizophila CBS 207.26]|uniref:AIG1-type G domain-containing protein n=1 Tax=Zopfia rhizophila CBS 207.26 TaxID=1314779 RepID=A0A6A6EPA6_9PEZI|nr:hypothetical protein K469DRAFT_619710 [Zopfia rhizophila CBS 207.26]
MPTFKNEADYSMILVMGLTGSGKSYFINRLAPGAVSEGAGVTSETESCEIVRLGIGRHHVALVDTPGFDDSSRSDDEILDEIVQFLCYQYRLGIPLKGIIYMHRITDNKMQGTAQRYFEMFKRLCGNRNMANVVLLTTMWNQLKDEGVGLRRDQELREQFWSVMEKQGSYIRRFDGSRAMAEAVICRLMRQKNIVLDIQQELVDQGMRLSETTAGQLMVPSIESMIGESAKEIQNLDRRIGKVVNVDERRRLQKQRASALEQRQQNLRRRERLQARPGEVTAQNIEEKKKSGKWKDTVSIFASLVGLAITTTVNVILPLAGVISF